VSRVEWQQPISPEHAMNRAAGRQRYNALRQRYVLMRAVQVCQRLAQGQSKQEIARALGVHRTTIVRNLQRLQTLTLRPSFFVR
jgi:DNA-binding NarL/FixJ family response regulator